METVEDAVKAVRTAAERPDKEIRIARRIEVGTCAAHQGDLYVHRVADGHKRGKMIAKGKVQVALGSNNGARHVAEGKVIVYTGVDLPNYIKPPKDVPASELCGPVIVAKDTWMLTHPEHAHHKLPAGTYQVSYQFDPKTMKRVAD